MLTWIVLLVYGVWTNGPFSFVVFYAGLQTVPQDTVESAKIDGANRWEVTATSSCPTSRRSRPSSRLCN